MSKFFDFVSSMAAFNFYRSNIGMCVSLSESCKMDLNIEKYLNFFIETLKNFILKSIYPGFEIVQSLKK